MLESLFNKENPTQVFSCEICDIFKSNFYTKHLQWLFLTDSGFQPATLLKNKDVFLWILRNFKEHLFGWLILVLTCEFWKVFQNTFFIEHLQETVAGLQPAYKVKNYFAGAFLAFCTRTISSHLKVFIHLKFLKIVVKLQDVIQQVYKKTY